jgi:hypothetical protein
MKLASDVNSKQAGTILLSGIKTSPDTLIRAAKPGLAFRIALRKAHQRPRYKRPPGHRAAEEA